MDIFKHKDKVFLNYQTLLSGRILLWPISMFLSLFKKEVVPIEDVIKPLNTEGAASVFVFGDCVPIEDVIKPLNTVSCDKTWVLQVSEGGDIIESHICDLAKGHTGQHKCRCGAEIEEI